MLAVILALLAPAQQPAGATAPESFTMTVPVSPDSEEGRRIVALRAVEACAGRYPRLGRYTYVGSTEVGGGEAVRYEVRQELVCLDAPPARPAEQPAPSDWQPGETDHKQIVELTERLFALTDAGRVEDVHGLWSGANQEMVPLAERRAALDDFRAKAGRPLQHRIAKITWYVNPPSAPTPGIYAAVDYERAYSQLAANCGFIVWFREPSGRYVITRQEDGTLPKEQAESLSLERLAQVRELLKCPAS